MKKVIFTLVLFSLCISLWGESHPAGQERDTAFYEATQKWFSAWKLVYQGIYKIDKLRPVDFVFFDDKYVYSTSAVSINKGETVKGNNLMNLKFVWKKKLHNDSLTLPDKSTIPISLLSFAAATPITGKAFFVMPLPGFWEQAGVSGNELGLENLVTGVFIHEFSHSQQMQNFGKKMTAYEKNSSFDVEFNDDIIQNLFSKDSVYKAYYNKEIETLFALGNAPKTDKKALEDGFSIFSQRQKVFFKGRYKDLFEIDNFFLTMEGLGQYSMYLWLTDPNGGNIQKETAIKGVRRGGKWWSQDEGFALFLILDKLCTSKNWAKDMFGTKIENIISLLNRLKDKKGCQLRIEQQSAPGNAASKF